MKCLALAKKKKKNGCFKASYIKSLSSVSASHKGELISLLYLPWPCCLRCERMGPKTVPLRSAVDASMQMWPAVGIWGPPRADASHDLPSGSQLLIRRLMVGTTYAGLWRILRQPQPPYPNLQQNRWRRSSFRPGFLLHRSCSVQRGVTMNSDGKGQWTVALPPQNLVGRGWGSLEVPQSSRCPQQTPTHEGTSYLIFLPSLPHSSSAFPGIK